MDNKWVAIMNPCAGTHQLQRDWNAVVEELKELPVEVKVRKTEYKGHAIIIAREELNAGCRQLLIFGGDGTLDEVVNGIYTSDVEDKGAVKLALIPYGTGNDWSRMWGLLPHKKDVKLLLKALTNGIEHKVDVGKVERRDGDKSVSYFLNAIGMGFDAVVVRYASNLKHRVNVGSWVYSVAVFMAILTHRTQHMQVTCDGEVTHDDVPVYTICVGNGCYTGGGLKQTLDAVPTDGYFHTMTVRKLNFWQICKAVKCLFTSTLQEHECMDFRKIKKYTFKSETPVEMESDGVQLGKSAHVEVSVIPNALTFVTPF